MIDVAFRVDASRRIGSGHVMRCLNLARALRRRGARARFVCREHDGHLMALLRDEGLPVAALARPAGGDGGDGYGAWLGASAQDDARETAAALGADRPDWLVVDHYGIDAGWERELRPRVGRTMLIDDLADRRHECELLLDQNFHEAGAARYASLVPPSCRLLAGPGHALLAPEYAQRRATLRPRDGRVTRVLVFFGGSDPMDATGRALDALAGSALRDVRTDVVVGASYAHAARLAGRLDSLRDARLHRGLPHLADLLAEADLALGAGGTTTWERMCLGVPALVVSIADNQRSSCEALSRAELIEYAGPLESTNRERLVRAIERLAADAARRFDLSARGIALVDGLGAERVADTLLD